MATKAKEAKSNGKGKKARSYGHPEAESLMRPDVGTQAQFKKKKEPKKYRYDSSLSPALEWDGQNPAREQGEALIKQILDSPGVELPESLRQQVTGAKGDLFVAALADALNAADKSIHKMKAAADKLRRLSKPFLNWAGKAERLSFDVPTLPLFVHERLSTKAILETLKGHKRDKQLDMFDLYGDPGHSITDQILRAYEHKDRWVNRMILGDSLVVMNSLLQYEGMGGKVQMIYMDPPYGVKFGSNFQPFVRKREVAHGDDDDMTREPEMVQAYRDTWELGLHSYLTYMRDRLFLCRDLLTQTGSIFVQISDENVHHVRELMSEVFGADNFCAEIAFRKTTGKGSALLDSTYDVLLWYAKDRSAVRFNRVFLKRKPSDDNNYRYVEDTSGQRRQLTEEEWAQVDSLPSNLRLFSANPLTSQSASATTLFDYEHEGRTYSPGKGGWKTNREGMDKLANARRLMGIGKTLRFIRYFDDFPYQSINNHSCPKQLSGV